MKNFSLALVCFAASLAHAADPAEHISKKQSEVMNALIAAYAAEAKEEAGQPVPAFSAQAGREFYLRRRSYQSHEYRCANCHTDNPTNEGRHIETKQAIKPLAPAANPERFTDIKKVEKNLTKHCVDLYHRDCSAQEKGDFLTYLMSVK